MRFDPWVRRGNEAKLTGPLQQAVDAGDINLRKLP